MASKIKDGIISYMEPQGYHNQSRKILFVLKEAVRRDKTKGGDEYCLLNYLYNGADTKSPTWNNTVIWSYLLRHYGDSGHDVSWERAKKVIKNRACELRKIAVVNINKKGGGSRTNDIKLYEGFKNDPLTQEELTNQIERDIKPDIILCGGRVVGECIKILYPNAKWEKHFFQNGIKSSYSKIGEKIFIQYYHPQYTGFTQMQLFKSLKELLDIIFSKL